MSSNSLPLDLGLLFQQINKAFPKDFLLSTPLEAGDVVRDVRQVLLQTQLEQGRVTLDSETVGQYLRLLIDLEGLSAVNTVL